ncbi:MAG: CoB--CoM heterodisulfide reductase iron-sulfur subunit D [Methanomassiliicoccales archaeon PtaU1.Bin124]|nr:MAG: CoB--CoM heterodisulfide reductase iron-sulfur subunit D [Methanomassiliicoccales archaeon PtaU1.Bin124]
MSERRSDIRSCVACGHCTYVCPASHYERNFTARGTAESFLLHGREGIDLWSCLTCHACIEVCPENVDFPRFMKQARASREKDEIPVRTHAGILESMRNLQATGKGGPRKYDWLSPGLEIAQDSPVALFVGCLPMLDIIFKDVAPRLLDIPNAAIFLLNMMGINPRLLPLERCCGHDAYWLGEMNSFKLLASHNSKMLREEGVEEVITVCPECSHTLGTVYLDVLGEHMPRVRHISQVLAEGLREGKLMAPGGAERITYQDPCRLGRMSRVFDEPRIVIGSIGSLVDMPRSREMAACCGSTCFMQCDKVVKRWQVDRLTEARNTGADALATACPKCLIHLGCAQKDFGTHKDRPKIRLEDETVLLARMLGWKG